ncbi:acylneuraminate cytidylyltransferase family protein [Clostridium sp. 'White wine YQ']|uniref:acylneuraminate cytidylyltransferase family protein n=1 Tax=Clostridium sp. 'White wine YQ' TaxID=3027474 RepID=UPI0023656620|nr:acylneuraminate cytidylyltransferase family protein [Clostridium sp. 'White wine YQ']MDD7794608.1 acylneuraminate cytidylyltransferase family protein [Clostridium sp. 'White wine YQ']
MKILITICGRAGSKGVKNKNIREFLGYPLVYYTMAIANKFKESCNHTDIDIAVNSDSKELIELAGKFKNINIVERPNELGKDDTPKIHVIKHTVDMIENNKQVKYDYVLDLDITSPIRTVEDLQNSINEMVKNKHLDVVFSVTHSRRNPYFNMVEVINGKVKKVKEANYVTRQQAPAVYDMNASIYCYDRNSLAKKIKNSPLEGECGIFLMKDCGVLDIDSEEDFKLMSLIASSVYENEFKELRTLIKKYLFF